MWGWFAKKPKWIDEPDEVYRTRARADLALVEAAKASQVPVIVAAFFPASLERLEELLRGAGLAVERLTWNAGVEPAPGSVLLFDASRVKHDYGFDGWLLTKNTGFSFLFVEHHPLPSVERDFLDVLDGASKQKPQRVRFFVGLDEPLMQSFGGERVGMLMERLGMNEDEVLRHPMIDRAIENAQKKLQKATPNALPARSVEEWFAQNVRG